MKKFLPAGGRQALAISIIIPFCGCDAPQTPPSQRVSQEVSEWSLVRELTVGSPDHPTQSLTQTESLTVDGDGRIFVAQPQDQRVSVFSPQGALLQSVGGGGEGPGEFRIPRYVGRVGDTLWVTESRVPSVSFFSGEGRFLRSVSLAKDMLEDEYVPSAVVGVFPDGTLLVRTSAEGRLVLSGEVSSFPLFRVDPGGQVLNRVASSSLGNTYLRMPMGGGREVVFPHPFPNRPLLTTCPGSPHLLALDRSPPVAGQSPAMRLSKISAGGDTLFSREIPYTPTPFPSDFSDSVKLAMAERLARSGAAPSAREALPGVERGLDLSSAAPPALHLLCGKTGEIWIHLTRPGSPEALWEILTPEGRPLARVEAPPSTIFHAANEDHAWAIEVDGLDVPYVVRYRIIREERGATVG